MLLETGHGYPIIERKPADGGGEIIIAFRAAVDSQTAADPYVVWRMDRDGACHGGQYVSTLRTALSRFAERR